MISRSRLRGDSDSIGVITNPGDEAIGLNSEQIERVKQLESNEDIGINPAARRVREPAEGLLILYPISKFSGQDLTSGESRRPLYDSPYDADARDVVGLALSFPKSSSVQDVRGTYTVGTAGWKPE